MKIGEKEIVERPDGKFNVWRFGFPNWEPVNTWTQPRWILVGVVVKPT